MNEQRLPREVLSVVLISLILTGCGSSAPTATPTPTIPPTASPTPKPTSTPEPTNTPTPTPLPTVDPSVVLIPRFILPAPPYSAVEILGTVCNYKRDEWNQKSAYVAYACPDLNVEWLSVRFTNLEEGETAEGWFGQLPPEGFTPLTPGDLLSRFDNIFIAGELDDGMYDYFMVYETEKFMISVEVFFPEDPGMTPEEFYPENGEVVLHAVLEIMLDKVLSFGKHPEPTPMASAQQNLYDQVAGWLVTESEANQFYQDARDMWGDPFNGNWFSIGDVVDLESQWDSVCRDFVDRSNADAPLVSFFNCVYHVGPDFDLEELESYFQTAVVLGSTYDYPGQSIIYGHDLSSGHTGLNGFVLQGEYLFYVFLESRTKIGQSPEAVFNGFNDGFIYNVIMTNLEHSGLDDVESSGTQADDDPFIGAWVSTDPGDGSNQQLIISMSGGEYSLVYTDDVASACGLDTAGNSIAATGTGVGTLNGNVLSVDYSIYCQTNPQSFLGSFHVDYTYNETTDTIEDAATIWTRP